MAEKTLNTRIQLKYDTYENWKTNNPVLKAGEVAIATVPSNQDGVQNAPSILLKVGDGTTAYNSLKFVSGMAADVYSWAKASTKPSYSASEISGLSSYISGEIQDTDTQYQIVKVDNYTYKLQSKTLSGNWADVTDGTISIPQVTVDSSLSATSTNPVQNQVIYSALSGKASTSTATETADGLMSSTDYEKLQGIEEGAQANTVTGVKGNSETAYRTGNINITAENIGLGNVTNESKVTMFTDAALTGTPTAPTAVSGTDSTQIATTAFVQSEINSKLAAADAMIFKGTLGASADSPTITALPATHSTGWTYKVVTAGTYAGQTCEIGDMVVCLADGTAANDAHWTVIQSNIDGAVTGPASAVDAHVATFDGATGKIIKDSGFTIGKSVPSDAVFTDTTYSEATTEKAGLMSSTDKTQLGKVTDEKISNWDTAYTNSHTHSNKNTLDGITSEKVSNWDGAATNSHIHGNKTILDSITQEKVNAWDAKMNSVTLASIATSGNVNDLVQTIGDTLIFDCGDSNI